MMMMMILKVHLQRGVAVCHLGTLVHSAGLKYKLALFVLN